MGPAFLCPCLRNVFFRLTADTEYDTSGSGFMIRIKNLHAEFEIGGLHCVNNGA